MRECDGWLACCGVCKELFGPCSWKMLRQEEAWKIQEAMNLKEKALRESDSLFECNGAAPHRSHPNIRLFLEGEANRQHCPNRLAAQFVSIYMSRYECGTAVVSQGRHAYVERERLREKARQSIL